jgi:hypothetical protein
VKIRLYTVLILLGTSLFQDCNPLSELNKTDAINCLKVLDSDITRYLDRINGSDAGRALHALLANDSAPFPVKFPRSFLQKRKLYDFQHHTGTWEWNAGDSNFIHSPGGDHIVIRYPLPGSAVNNATCVIYRYEEAPTTSAHSFPLHFSAGIFIEERKVFTIEYTASMEQDIPVSLNTTISMDDGFLRLSFENRLDTVRKRGDIHAAITAGSPAGTILDGTVKAKIKTFSGGTYAVLTFSADIRLFDCVLVSDIDYAGINPTSREYVKEFNEHAQIQLYTKGRKEKIGDIVMKAKKNDKILDFAFRFSDLSEDFLSNYVLAFKKILDVKTTK